jgi:hypothetical protein
MLLIIDLFALFYVFWYIMGYRESKFTRTLPLTLICAPDDLSLLPPPCLTCAPPLRLYITSLSGEAFQWVQQIYWSFKGSYVVPGLEILRFDSFEFKAILHAHIRSVSQGCQRDCYSRRFYLYCYSVGSRIDFWRVGTFLPRLAYQRRLLDSMLYFLYLKVSEC